MLTGNPLFVKGAAAFALKIFLQDESVVEMIRPNLKQFVGILIGMTIVFILLAWITIVIKSKYI